MIEPFLHMNTRVTATDYANFYALRRQQDAQPEIKALLPRPRTVCDAALQRHDHDTITYARSITVAVEAADEGAAEAIGENMTLTHRYPPECGHSTGYVNGSISMKTRSTTRHGKFRNKPDVSHRSGRNIKTDFNPARSEPAVHTVNISLEQQVEVEMIRASLRYFGSAIWAGLGIWFVAGLPWL